MAGVEAVLSHVDIVIVRIGTLTLLVIALIKVIRRELSQ